MSLPLPDPPLGDGVIALRPPGDEDLPRIVAVCNDPLVQRFTRIPNPYGVTEGRDFIKGARARRESGASLELMAVPAGGGEVIGCIGITRDRHDARRVEIGYWVAPDARGAGVATRSLMLLSRWAIRDAGVLRIDLEAAAGNRGSQVVAERCGFVLEGTLRDAWHRGPRREAMLLYSLLPSDLAAET
ncbi:MAG: GNAT family N-acetyltransferase [Thermoleophilia bacterium]